LISSSAELDILHLFVMKDLYFISQFGEILEPQIAPLKFEIPPQISISDAENVEAVGSIINSVLTGPAGLVTNLFLALAL